jgi:hypothetical protein
MRQGETVWVLPKEFQSAFVGVPGVSTGLNEIFFLYSIPRIVSTPHRMSNVFSVRPAGTRNGLGWNPAPPEEPVEA